ncbi:Nucleolin 2-like protein [Drosera capensis]
MSKAQKEETQFEKLALDRSHNPKNCASAAVSTLTHPFPALLLSSSLFFSRRHQILNSSKTLASQNPKFNGQVKEIDSQGKRDAEEAIEKIVSTKKQKAQKDGVVVAKKIMENKTQKKKKKQGSSSSDSDDSDSEDEMDTKPAVPATVKAQSQTKKAEAESESDSDDDESESDQDTKAAASTAVKAQPQEKKAENESESESEDDDDSDSYEIPAINPEENSELSEDSEDEQPSDEEDSQDEQPSKASKKKDGDVKMVDASNPGKGPNQVSDKKAPKTPAKPQSQESGSKTLYVGNLPYSTKQEDVHDVAEIEEVRFASDQDGRFKGFAHIEFARAEDAKKALELQPLDLSGRTLRLDFAGERGSYSPHSKENNSFQKGGRAEEKSLFIRGFDKSLGEDQIRNALQEHFGSCGEITRVSIPKDYESGAVKGIAYMDFKDGDGFNSALELNGSELGGFELQVEQAKPRGDSRGDGGDRSGGRSGRGGRFGGRRGRGGGDWSGDRGRGRDSGGRFGGRRDRGGFSSGRRGRGGDRGHGTPNKFGVGSGRGKKTTFGDD